MKHILYTVKEGGDFRYRYVSFHDDKETVKAFKKARETGILEMKVGDSILPTPLAFIMLLEDIDDYDFILKSKR